MDKVWKLSNGCEIPNICYGTGILHRYRYGDCSWISKSKYDIRTLLYDKKQFKADRNFKHIIKLAKDNGCTMFDTSRAYDGAEFVLGKALKQYDREEVYVVTKLSNRDQINSDAYTSLRKSLSELQMDYVDLYLIHWPVTDKYIESWKMMEKMYKDGLCKAIGVCNCNIHHLENIKREAEIMPMVNEIECHPLFTQNELRAYCKENNIRIMAYTSTARNDDRLRSSVLGDISKKHQKSITQVILRWHQQLGNIPIFNSYNKKHLLENLDIDNFNLTDSEMEEILKININSRLRYDPDNCDFTKL